jgi:hypothetical protein
VRGRRTTSSRTALDSVQSNATLDPQSVPPNVCDFSSRREAEKPLVLFNEVSVNIKATSYSQAMEVALSGK